MIHKQARQLETRASDSVSDSPMAVWNGRHLSIVLGALLLERRAFDPRSVTMCIWWAVWICG